MRLPYPSQAKAGFVQAVRRVFDGLWEVYRVVDGLEAEVEVDGLDDGTFGSTSNRMVAADRGRGSGNGAVEVLPAVERLSLACTYGFKPRAAVLLANAARRNREAHRLASRSGGVGSEGGAASKQTKHKGEVPGRPAHEVPFSAEDGWEWDGRIEWES